MTSLRVRNSQVLRVRVSELVDAPWNHRLHPSYQAEALDGAIDELGFYGYPDVFRAADGSLMLIDGHLRKERLLAQYGPDAEIEVNVTDFDESEAKKANLTKDPIAAMAETNAAKLDELLGSVQTDSDALQRMLADLARASGSDWVKQFEQQEQPIDPDAEWVGMPECSNDELSAIKSIKVNFRTLDDMQAFAALIGQTVTENTRSLWYPQAEIGRYADKSYVDES